MFLGLGGKTMRRRDFIKGIAGSATSWPLAASAQGQAKRPTIGFLGTPTPSAWSLFTQAFVQRLSELNWIEGRTVNIEYRWAENHYDRFAEIAAEFVRLKVDVIVTSGLAVPAAKQATSLIPIVFAVANDPVGYGLVSSLARPGGNVTGLSMQTTDTASKRLELLREVVPSLRRLAILFTANTDTALDMRETEEAASRLGVDVTRLEIRRAEDIAPAFKALNGGADALFVATDPLIVSNRFEINNLALSTRLPTVYVLRAYVEAGGLMSFGPNLSDLFRRAAEMVDKILRGAKPADIPVEQPTKFDLVINLKTAKALGLAFPQSILATADEVIE
jgi:putative tryptophan/tyrosine transport system substrate-binding protein